jgi:hypothetical protein
LLIRSKPAAPCIAEDDEDCTSGWGEIILPDIFLAIAMSAAVAGTAYVLRD